ncbi:MAG: ferredoxin [Candidatus Electrothrix sp. GW3-4]|uniref:ferredoxin n=1 Tax=Candidatus Electrothrix sp. GW3-4 TaxID=3126740 RepID=UPI0030CE8729
MAEVIIDTYQCSGCETCVEICPDVFYIDEVTEKAGLVSPSPYITDALRQAAAFCPEKCIAILE